jgi:SAM-dependent methyltransferase
VETRGPGSREVFYSDVHRAYASPLCVERYASKLLVERPEPIRAAIERFVDVLPSGARVLDLGCGPGREIAHMQARCIDAIGLDSSAEMLRQAEKCVGPDCLVRGDMLELAHLGHGSFDGVLALASLQHIHHSDLDRALVQIRGVLRPAGLLLVITKLGAGTYLDTRLGEGFVRPTALWTESGLQSHLAAAGFGVLDLRTFELERDGLPDQWIAALTHRLEDREPDRP